MNQKIAYVTGATGCVGRNIANELLAQNWQVIILHRASSDLSRLRELPLDYREVDLHNIDSVREAMTTHADAIFHAAGNTSHWNFEKDQQWRDNVLATRNLVQIAREMKITRFIFTSTNATQNYQGTDAEFASKIKSSYVRTKRLSELEIYEGIKKGLDAVILRPIIVIGAYDYNSYAQIFLNLKTNRIRFAFPGRIPFCHARDVARAHLKAFEKGRCSENYVLGGTHTTWQNTFQKIANILGVRSKVHVAPKLLLWLAAHFMNLISKITKIKPLLTPELVNLLEDSPDVSYYDARKSQIELDYVSGSLDSMIQDCFDWLKTEGRI